MGKCYYCGIEYDRLSRYTRPKEVVSVAVTIGDETFTDDRPLEIHVCHLQQCSDRARADGYTYRPPAITPGLEICHYCGKEYHPMPVYELQRSREQITTDTKLPTSPDDRPIRITVCHLKVIVTDGGVEIDDTWRGCAEKAIADGYEYRRDLTPTR